MSPLGGFPTVIRCDVNCPVIKQEIADITQSCRALRPFVTESFETMNGMDYLTWLRFFSVKPAARDIYPHPDFQPMQASLFLDKTQVCRVIFALELKTNRVSPLKLFLG